MTLAELAAATGLTANDLIGIWDAEASGSTEPTQKLTAQQLAAAVKGLANLVDTAELAEKQDKLTFDTTPTTGSNNPVTSGGVADAITQSTASMKFVTGSVDFANGDYAKTVTLGGIFTNVDSAVATPNVENVTAFAVIASNNSVTIARRPVTAACKVFYMVHGT